jgi:hypothetical protein
LDKFLSQGAWFFALKEIANEFLMEDEAKAPAPCSQTSPVPLPGFPVPEMPEEHPLPSGKSHQPSPAEEM